MSEIKSVKDADVKGKRVLVRVDFNAPIQDGKVLDDSRIKAAIPTIKFLQEKGAEKIILISHLGRPNGKTVESLKMKPVAENISQNLTSKKSSDLSSAPSYGAASQTFLQQGFVSYQIEENIFLLENLRFAPREEANDDEFAKELAALGDIFVNEAFADSHREHASIVGIPKYLPSFIGLRFEEEIKNLSGALTPPAGSIALIGGAKFETKHEGCRSTDETDHGLCAR